jgi:hypothetical protein
MFTKIARFLFVYRFTSYRPYKRMENGGGDAMKELIEFSHRKERDPSSGVILCLQFPIFTIPLPLACSPSRIHTNNKNNKHVLHVAHTTERCVARYRNIQYHASWILYHLPNNLFFFFLFIEMVLVKIQESNKF